MPARKSLLFFHGLFSRLLINPAQIYTQENSGTRENSSVRFPPRKDSTDMLRSGSSMNRRLRFS